MGILDAPGLAPHKASAAYNRPLYLAALSDSLLGYGEGVPTYIEIMSNQRLRFSDPSGTSVRNVFSYSGQNTAYLLANIAAVTGLAKKPQACIVQGGTNDVIAATSLSTIMSNLTAIYDKLEAAGIRPIISTLPPLGGPYQYAAMRQPARAVNLALRRHAANTGRMIVDPYLVLIDPATARYLATPDSGDNVHPSPAGIKTWAQHIIDRLASNLGSTIDLTLLERCDDGNAMLVYTRFATGNGNFAGSANAGLAADLGASTAQTGFTPSLVASDITGINWQRITVSGASATQGIYQATAATVFAGQVIQAAMRYRSGQDCAGSDKVRVYMRTFAGAVEKGNFELTGPGSGISRQIADGILHTTFVVPAGATSCQLNILIPPSAGTYDFAQPSLYNLTALGAV